MKLSCHSEQSPEDAERNLLLDQFGPKLYSYQRAWIEDNSRFKIACKARQIGFTYAAALRVVDKRLSEPGLTLWLSASERQALEAMEHVRQFARDVDAAALNEEEFVEGTSIRQHSIQFSNGSRIIALPSNPDTVRGFAGDIVLDEFAFHRDADAIWRAAFAIATRGFQLEIISTPNGARGRYYELAKAAGLVDFPPPSDEELCENPFGKVFSRSPKTFCSDVDDPASSGVTASQGKSLEGVRGKPFFRKVPTSASAAGAVWSAHWIDLSLARTLGFVVDVESLRAAIGDEESWQQEYCCRFLSQSAHYLPPELVVAAEHTDATTTPPALFELWRAGPPLVVPGLSQPATGECLRDESQFGRGPEFIPPTAGAPPTDSTSSGRGAALIPPRKEPRQGTAELVLSEAEGAVPNKASREAQKAVFVGQGFSPAESNAAPAATSEGSQGNPRRVPLSLSNQLFLGVDIGRHRDLTVLWLLEIENSSAPPDARTYLTRGVITLTRQPFSQQRATLDAFLTHRLSAQENLRGETFLKKGSPHTPSKDFPGDAARPLQGAATSRQKVLGERENTFPKGFSQSSPYAVRRCAVDASGMGAMLAEELQQKWGSRVEPVVFTAAVKEEMAVRVKRLLEDGRLKIPADPAIRAALNSVKREVTQAGNLRFDAERTQQGGHADHFWALALALHTATESNLSTDFVSSATRKAHIGSAAY